MTDWYKLGLGQSEEEDPLYSEVDTSKYELPWTAKLGIGAAMPTAISTAFKLVQVL